jgi:hypothetical protein
MRAVRQRDRLIVPTSLGHDARARSSPWPEDE